MIQILPILYKSYYSRDKDDWGTVIRLIEQPELHIHPWLQCKTAEFFCHDILRDRSFIIETHSEHLLRKIQILIAKADKKSGHEDLMDRVAVYYFDKNDKTGITTVNEMKMDNLGRFTTSWPLGFFDVDTELTLDFFKTMSKN